MSSFPSQGASALLALSNDLAAAVEQTGPCVVAVKARSRISSSGVHWQQGIVVAADETIRRSEDITVTVSDGTTVAATLVGRDPSTDIAILKLPDLDVPPEVAPAARPCKLDLPVAQIKEATSLKVGHLVLAVGRSEESGLNASLGAVSAVGGAWHSSYGGLIDQLVRLDLNLYPNLEGGPLVDATGQVVGIAVSGPRRTVLAIPTATINRVVTQLLEKGRIARGYLGLGMQPVRLPERLKQSLNLPSLGGVIVVNVEPNGPAEQVGATIGDVIVALDGTPVSDTRDVQAMLSPDRVSKILSVRIVRGGTLLELEMTVGERPRREA